MINLSISVASGKPCYFWQLATVLLTIGVWLLNADAGAVILYGMKLFQAGNSTIRAGNTYFCGEVCCRKRGNKMVTGYEPYRLKDYREHRHFELRIKRIDSHHFAYPFYNKDKQCEGVKGEHNREHLFRYGCIRKWGQTVKTTGKPPGKA